MVQQILVQMGAAVSSLICVQGQLFPLTWASSVSGRAFLERSVQQEQTCFIEPKIKPLFFGSINSCYIFFGSHDEPYGAVT